MSDERTQLSSHPNSTQLFTTHFPYELYLTTRHLFLMVFSTHQIHLSNFTSLHSLLSPFQASVYIFPSNSTTTLGPTRLKSTRNHEYTTLISRVMTNINSFDTTWRYCFFFFRFYFCPSIFLQLWLFFSISLSLELLFGHLLWDLNAEMAI